MEGVAVVREVHVVGVVVLLRVGVALTHLVVVGAAHGVQEHRELVVPQLGN